MFRDPHIASQEKELARLREELRRVKSDDEEKLRKLQEAEARLAKEKAQKKRRFKWRLPTDLHMLHVIGFVLALCMIVWGVYHYFHDIQEGVVTSKEHHPARTICNDDGCTHIPENWTVDIAYRGQTATWSVSEDEYRRLRRGQWFCFSDFLHPRSNCHGPDDTD